jgi:hypothetical protein
MPAVVTHCMLDPLELGSGRDQRMLVGLFRERLRVKVG